MNQTIDQTKNPFCTSCNQEMQYAGQVSNVVSYWCEDCDIEGHITLQSICEYCRKNTGAESRAMGIICEECWISEAKRRSNFDRFQDGLI